MYGTLAKGAGRKLLGTIESTNHRVDVDAASGVALRASPASAAVSVVEARHERGVHAESPASAFGASHRRRAPQRT
jgi:hypothetical protein